MCACVYTCVKAHVFMCVKTHMHLCVGGGAGTLGLVSEELTFKDYIGKKGTSLVVQGLRL